MFILGVNRFLIKIILLSIPFAALFYSSSVILPLTLPRIILFRALVEVAVLLFVVYISLASSDVKKATYSRFKSLYKNPISIFLTLYLLSYVVSTLFADNIYRAFWGSFERGEGVFGMLHFVAYFLLLYLVFEKKDWVRYLAIFLLSGLFLSLHSFYQFINPTIDFQGRATSTIGNPAFLATHLIFIMIFGASLISLFLKSDVDGKKMRLSIVHGKKNHIYILIIFLALFLTTIFLTGTRGAILGAGIGLLFILFYLSFSKKNIFLSNYSLKNFSRYLLIIFIAFGLLFFGTRNADIWKGIPGLNRLANTKAFSLSDSSTQFRLLTWGVSYEAFKERPLFGWGPENYLNAYEKYYDPAYSNYGDTWLDRAHNKLFDVLVMQGLLGLILYLGFISSIFYFILKRIYKENIALSIVLMAGVTAYFVQNLFLFDQIISNITFFCLFAFIVAYAEGDKGINSSSLTLRKANEGLVVIGLSLIVGITMVASLYYFNLIPYAQAKLYMTSPKGKDIERTYELLNTALYPYNFAQTSLRGSGIDALYMQNYFYNQRILSEKSFSKLTDLLVKSIHEVVEVEPYDVRFHIREGQMLAEIARTYEDGDPKVSEINSQIEKLMLDAIERSPKRQDLYYHLAFILV